MFEHRTTIKLAKDETENVFNSTMSIVIIYLVCNFGLTMKYFMVTALMKLGVAEFLKKTNTKKGRV